MSVLSTLGSIPGTLTGPLASGVAQGVKKTILSATENTKIEKSAKDFESILLGSWLQQAEQSFAAMPGGDDEGDADSGKEQFQGMAMQSLGTSMTAAGGIGIAKMISKQLHKSDNARVGLAGLAEASRTK
jgi:Rod binding domain-containing protein